MIVVGDLGSGKSTLLTAMSGGAARFRSGISFAGGLTDQLRSVVVGGTRYSDTPGLDDQALGSQAANAIAGALRLGGIVKLVFVLTLEAGRLRSANLVAMRVVLDGLAGQGIRVDGRFSAIVNKMSPDELNKWDNPKGCGRALLQDHLGEAHALGPLMYLPRDESINENARNGTELPHSLHLPAFLLGACAPGIVIPPGTRVWVPAPVPAGPPPEPGDAAPPSPRKQRSRASAPPGSPPASAGATAGRGAAGRHSPPQRRGADGHRRHRSASLDGVPTTTGCLPGWRRQRDGGRPGSSSRAGSHNPSRGY